MEICSQEVDFHAGELVRGCFKEITEKWQSLLDPITTIITKTPLENIGELQRHYPRPDWLPDSQAAMLHLGEETVAYARYAPRPGIDPEYSFRKEFLSHLALAIWEKHPEVRERAKITADEIVTKGGLDFAVQVSKLQAAFRHSFSCFFLPPEWKDRKRIDNIVWMERLDLALFPRVVTSIQ